MSNKYNLIPGACHFLPFFSGEDANLHYSYTADYMYCLEKLNVAGTQLKFVESRPVDEDAKSQLNAMASDDYMSAMHLFGSLPKDHKAHAELNELLYGYRLSATNEKNLQDSLKNTEPGSEGHLDIEAQLDLSIETMREQMRAIENIVNRFNRNSGYNSKTGTIESQAT
jgi:hypothetical protein